MLVVLRFSQWPQVGELGSYVMLDIGICPDLVTSTACNRVKGWPSTGPACCNNSDISRLPEPQYFHL